MYSRENTSDRLIYDKILRSDDSDHHLSGFGLMINSLIKKSKRSNSLILAS